MLSFALDSIDHTEVKYCSDYKLEEIKTPINVNRLEELLQEIEYNMEETEFLCTGFRNGFSLGYEGPDERTDEASNLPFTVGSPTELWNKVMSEVEEGCFAGPYEKIPFTHYVQLPIGLVPKAGNKTRLIFHLSYKFKNGNPSVNECTPPEVCSVKYNNLDSAVRDCIFLMKEMGIQTIYFSKSDLKNAFRILGILPSQRWLLVMKARDPKTHKWYYFVDKCLPFGSSISCAHFQRFSNALRVIVEWISGRIRQTLITNLMTTCSFISQKKAAIRSW